MSIKKRIARSLADAIKRSYWYKELKFKDCQKFWDYNTFNTDIINLGSTSGVCSFNYEGIPLKCANWALSTNPLLGDLAILKNYYSFLKEHATVIIPLCPFSSFAGNYSITADRYYSLLYPSTIPGFSLLRYHQVNREKINPMMTFPLLGILYDLKALFKKKDTLLSEQQMREDSNCWIESWKKEFCISDFSYPTSIINLDGVNEAGRILNQIILFCKERYLKPAILIPPVYHTLGNLFTNDIRRQIIDSLIESIEDKNVWFHNYMDDSDFTNDISLFQNSFLMNGKGGKLFTRRVLRDLGLIN